MADKTYFELEDDFKGIIEKSLEDKKIIDIKFISTGWTNIVYEVETDKGDFFFRFPRDEFWARTIVKDYEFAKSVYKKTDFNTIKLELLYDNGRPFSMHKKIPGVPLASKMNELTSDEVKNISDEIAKFMYQLHQIEYNENEVFSIDNIGLDLKSFLDELLRVHVSKEDMKFWKVDLNKNEEKCLVHGDLNLSNILLDDNNNLSAIIDFGFGGYGNKYDDVARVLSRECPENFKDEIIKSYEKYSDKKIDEDVLNREINTWTNIDQAYINYMRKIGIYE